MGMFSPPPTPALPAPPPAGPTLSDRIVREAGLSAAAASGLGRAGSFFTKGSGPSAPVPGYTTKASVPALPWDYGIADLAKPPTIPMPKVGSPTGTAGPAISSPGADMAKVLAKMGAVNQAKAKGTY